MNSLDKDEEGWAALVSKTLGDDFHEPEKQKFIFAMTLLKIMPALMKTAIIKSPNRKDLSALREQVDILERALQKIRDLKERSDIADDLIDWSLRHKMGKMDFLDVYWFAVGLKDLVNDEVDKFKPGPNADRGLFLCKAICMAFEKSFDKPPTCYGFEQFRQTGDLLDATPYERACYLVRERYSLPSITWSVMRKASQTYKDRPERQSAWKNLMKH